VHICFICNEYPPAPHGGYGSFVQTLGRALVRRGHEVSVVGVYPEGYGGEINDHGVKVYRQERKASPGLRVLSAMMGVGRMLKKLQAERPVDLVEGSEDGFYLARGVAAPRVLRMHGGHFFFQHAQGKAVPWRLQIQEKWSFRTATDIAAVSHYVAEKTRELLRLGRREITVIPNAIDVEHFQPAAPELVEPGLIVFIGTMIEKKGVRQLVAAMERIVAAVPRARLELYGGDTVDPETGGSYEARIQALVPEGLRDRIAFRGRVARTEIPGILARAELCCYPSHMEAHPIAWLEALAAGKALVASATGPGPEVLEDGVTGVLCNPYDPESIATAVIRVMQDEALRRRLERNARQRAVTAYALPQLVDRNVTYYESRIAAYRSGCRAAA